MASGSGQGAVLGYLKYVLGFDSLAFQQGLGDADKRLKAAQRSLGKTADKFKSIGVTMSAALTAPLIGFGALAMNEAKEAAAAMGQVNAALKSMGPVAGRTADQLKKASDSLEMRSLFEGDEILKKVTANLLTFGNVAGASFDRAQQAAVDLATRMDTDLQSAAILVGKALNAPLKGMTALGRAGIQFSEDQKAAIKTMVETGNVAGAQSIILGELERQFGGAAQAAQNTDPMNKATDAFKQMAETVGNALLPIIPVVTDAIVSVANAFNQLSPGMQKAVIIAGGVAAALGPVMIGVGGLISVFSSLLPLIGGAGLAGAFAALGPIILPVVAAVAALAAVWALFGDKIGPVLKELWTSLQASLGPKFQELVTTVTKALTDLWTGPFGDGIRAAIRLWVEFNLAAMKALGPALIAAISAVADLIGGAFKLIGGTLDAVAKLLSGDFSGAWKAAEGAIIGAASAILRAADTLSGGVLGAIARMVTGIGVWIGQKLRAIWEGAIKGIQWVGDKFKWLWDVVVGHSYIPDMVDAIGFHMARLDDLMVNRAGRAANKTAAIFRKLYADVVPILDRLFPERARANQYATERALVDTLPATMRGEALHRLNREYFADKGGLGGTKGGLASGAGSSFQLDTSPLAALKAQKFEAQQYWSDVIRGGFFSALDGNFGRWFEGFMKERLNNALTGLFDRLGKELERVIGGLGKGGGGGDFFSMIGSLFGGGGGNAAKFASLGSKIGSLPGFATGGSFKIGGFGGTDRNLLSINHTPAAWVSRGESMYVDPGKGSATRGGRTINIYANDAVLASTVRQWVTEGMYAAETGAVSRVVRGDQRRQQRRLGRQ